MNLFRPKRVTECVGLRMPSCCRDLQASDDVDRAIEVSRTLLRRRDAERNGPQDHEQNNEAHVLGKVKTCATGRG